MNKLNYQYLKSTLMMSRLNEKMIKHAKAIDIHKERSLKKYPLAVLYEFSVQSPNTDPHNNNTSIRIWRSDQ